jgi:hypothetical protein
MSSVSGGLSSISEHSNYTMGTRSHVEKNLSKLEGNRARELDKLKEDFEEMVWKLLTHTIERRNEND